MNIISKARARGINRSTIIAWLSIKLMNLWGLFWGTLRLRLKASILGVKLGKNVKCHGNIGLFLWPGGHIEIGSNVLIVSSWRRATAAALGFPTRLRVFGPGASISLGAGAQLTGASIAARSKPIKIGEGVLLGPNCIIVDSDFHAPWPAHARAYSPGFENDAPVTIEKFAWLGMHTIVLKGVTIGEGSIIGAGSVVTRDIPPNSVACGAPCRVIRTLPASHA